MSPKQLSSSPYDDWSESDDAASALIVRAGEAIIKHPRYKELHAEIARCQRISRLAGEPQCLTLEGQTGAGKSTLLEDYAAQFPRTETATGSRLRVLYAAIPSPASPRTLAGTMLDKLGDPAAFSGTLAMLNERLVTLMKTSCVELVILDDFHHLLNVDTPIKRAQISDWLKVLIKRTGVPFLVVSVPGKVKEVLSSNPQLSRLFAIREKLLPFAWDLGDPRTTREFHKFIEYAEAAIGLPLNTGLERIDLLHRLWYATNGVVANIMNLLRYAQQTTLENGGDRITLDILSQAYARRLQEFMNGRTNPFLAPPPEGGSGVRSASDPPLAAAPVAASPPLPSDQDIGSDPSQAPKRGRPKKEKPNILYTLSAS